MRPESAAYLLSIASCLEAAGDPERALAVLDLAVEGGTGAAEALALALKGDLLRSRGELQPAADLFDPPRIVVAVQLPPPAQCRLNNNRPLDAAGPLPPELPRPPPDFSAKNNRFALEA